ncbi:ABC transporter G family member 25 [Raphanus sativus]|uniref:ABC transporter G family member 25 n=2 Tax=Raphanus sativus TaxID=3726 RepID=A0A6J0LC52_RAPSA|nr:ABC transporter G family member 25 [Raphanus sativus]KAJ4874901.1 ABC transporter G family member 25 [Raphanus sativus]
MSGFDGFENQMNGPDSSPRLPQDHRDQPSSLFSSSPCFPITLKFVDVCYRVKIHGKSSDSLKLKRLLGLEHKPSDETPPTERTILSGVTGMVTPGEFMAVLGPSGSGKSTLLNAVAGRLHGPGLTGKILANDAKLTKQSLKLTGFVAQDDLLYPHLTVRETLVFVALLRLPRSLTRDDKIKAAEAVISELGLAKCENTVVGNTFIRGISGGERKRVSIAHELLINPSLLVLDEPTSGLDATAALRLVQTLAGLARGKGKTVVTSIHQPSSRAFQMFDTVLLLSEGRCLFVGKGRDAMAYFESVGFSPAFPMNPADFLLDLANGVCQIDGITEQEKPDARQTLAIAYDTLLAPNVRACIDASPSPAENARFVKTRKNARGIMSGLATWSSQLCILLHRLIKERRHESFDALRIFQVLAASLLCSLMWWHSDYRDVHDRLGLLFFVSIFWGVLPSFNAVFTFPQERAIFTRERASGMYTLSSYFMAHVIGSLTMELVLPAAFLTLTYWMVGLRPGLIPFLLTLSVLLLYVLASQGLGLALGAAIMDAKKASTIVTVTMLAFVLTGGYYVNKVPSGMVWMKYVSTTFYCYRLLIAVQYGNGDEILAMVGCKPKGTQGAAKTAGCRFMEEEVIGDIGLWTSVSALFFMFVGYRVLAYLALRRIKL